MQDFEKSAYSALTTYIEALNAQDSDAMRDCFHFPHYRIAGGRMEIFETAADCGIANFHARNDTGSWAYTEWDHRHMVYGDAAKVHFDVQFTRYRADDSALGPYKSLLIVTKRSDKWGVMARSSYAG